jgi:hypothetical protein
MADNILKVLLSGDSKELDAALSRADKKLKDFGESAKRIGQTLSVSLTAPLAIAGGAAIKMASDYEESLNKVNVAFKDSAGEVRAFAKTTLKSFGIAEGTALDMAALFGDMSTSMGLSTKEATQMSKSLVGLAGDLASFKNMDIKEVTTALNGVFTGETESLKRLAIVLTEDNLKAFALSKGIKAKYEAMTQGEKVMLRYQYVMNATKNSQGDFARTSEGSANQMRVFQETMKELGVTFGQVVLPTVTKVIHALNGMLGYLKDLPPATKLFLTGLAGITALVGPFLYFAGTVIPQVITGVKLLRIAFTNLGTTIKSAGIIGLISAMAGAALEQQSALSDANDALTNLSDEEKTNANAIRSKNKELYESIKAYEVLRKSAATQDAIYKAQTNQDRNTAKTYEDKIAAAKAFIVANRQVLKSAIALEKTTPAAKPDLDFTFNDKGDPKAGKKAEKIAQAEAERIQNERTKSGEQARDEYEKILADIFKINESTAEQTSTMYLSERDKEYDALNSSFAEQLALRERFGQSSTAIQEKYRLDKLALDAKYDQQELLATTDMYAQDQELLDSNNAQSLAKLQYFKDQIAQNYALLKDASAQVFSEIGNIIVQAFGPATSLFEKLAQAIAGVLIQMGAMALAEKLFGAAAIKSKQAQAEADAVKIGTSAAVAAGPAGLAALIPFIAASMGAVKGAFATIPKFAAGGIVSGPTMGIMGEYAGARSNPEVIAPLNKLQGMLDTGGGGGAFTLETKVSGQDLLLVLQRAEKQNKRLG